MSIKDKVLDSFWVSVRDSARYSVLHSVMIPVVGSVGDSVETFINDYEY